MVVKLESRFFIDTLRQLYHDIGNLLSLVGYHLVIACSIAKTLS